MADLGIPIAQHCHRPPDTVIQNDAFVFSCPVCGKTIEICSAHKVKIHPNGNFVAPVRAVDAAIIKWNAKEDVNGG